LVGPWRRPRRQCRQEEAGRQMDARTVLSILIPRRSGLCETRS